MLEFRQLSIADVGEIEQHFLALNAEDRYNRFRQACTDEIIHKHVLGIDFSKDVVVGCFCNSVLIGLVKN